MYNLRRNRELYAREDLDLSERGKARARLKEGSKPTASRSDPLWKLREDAPPPARGLLSRLATVVDSSEGVDAIAGCDSLL